MINKSNVSPVKGGYKIPLRVDLLPVKGRYKYFEAILSKARVEGLFKGKKAKRSVCTTFNSATVTHRTVQRKINDTSEF